MKNKKIIIVIIIIVILLAIGIIGFIIQKNQSKTNTEWGDMYVKHIKEISDNLEDIENIEETEEGRRTYVYGLPSGAKDVSATFLDIDKDENPELITQYACDNKKGITLTFVENDKFDYRERFFEELLLLYDIEEKEYDYYIKYYNEENKTYIYESFKKMMQNQTSKTSFTKEQLENDFKQKFIVIDTQIDFFDVKPNMNENEIVKNVKNAVIDYKSIADIITEETKQQVEEEVKIIEEKQAEVKAQEEKAAKEAEAKAKAEEEAKKKAEEEEKKGIKVGKYTLKYGKYKGAGGTENGRTFIINPDKTYTWIWADGSKHNGTWFLLSPNSTELSLDGDQWSMPVIEDNVLQTLSKDATYSWYSE